MITNVDLKEEKRLRYKKIASPEISPTGPKTLFNQLFVTLSHSLTHHHKHTTEKVTLPIPFQAKRIQPFRMQIRSPVWHTSPSFTWQWISRGVDLHKNRLALQAVLHGIDTDVVQIPRSKVT